MSHTVLRFACTLLLILLVTNKFYPYSLFNWANLLVLEQGSSANALIKDDLLLQAQQLIRHTIDSNIPSSHAYYILGFTQQLLGDPVQALIAYEQGLSSTSVPGLFYVRMGDAEWARGHSQLAIDYWHMSAASMIFLGRVKVATHRGNAQEALLNMMLYDNLHVTHPAPLRNYLNTALLLGTWLHREGELEQAISVLDKAVTRGQNLSDSLFLAHLHATLARVLFEEGLYDRGISATTRAIELNPENHSYLILRAQLYLEKDEEQLGLQDLEKARNSSSSEWHSIAVAELGKYYRGRAAYDQALALLEVEVRSAPESLPIRFELATLYSLLARREEACQQYRAILRLQPHHPTGNAGVERTCPK